MRELMHFRRGSEVQTDAETNPLDEAWLYMKLIPERTGLPMAIWITPNEDYPHGPRVKVSRIHGGRGRWSDAASVTVRPEIRLVVPRSLSAADFRVVSRWIELNLDLIDDYWEHRVDSIGVGPRLKKLE
jgi:hypothetical protein